MGKNKLLKENETLKLKIESLVKEKIYAENDIFNKKIETVIKTLESLGELTRTLDIERSDMMFRRTFTFTLKI